MSKYNWSNVPKEVKWIATDGLCDRCFGYSRKPNLTRNGWDKLGRMDIIFNLNIGAYSGDWKDSLEERPNE